MKNLIPIIGEAPSELEFEVWLETVRAQRNRTREAITSYLATPPKGTPKPRGITKTGLKKALAESGVSEAELKALLEEM